MKMHTILIQIFSEPVRADQALVDTFRKQGHLISRRELKLWFQNRQISLIQNETQTLVRAGDLLSPGSHTILLQDCILGQTIQPASHCFLPVVYEDAELLILDKKSGVPSSPLSLSEENTALQAALAHFPGLANVKGFHPRELGLVHRLDTGTSGLLLFAKSTQEWARLRTSFKDRKIGKYYQTFVTLNQPIPRFPHPIKLPLTHQNPKKMKVLDNQVPNSKKNAVWQAHTTLLSSPQSLLNVAEFLVQIHTGVTHQIRCHLSSQGWPILGDSIYGGKESSRLWLHASRLIIPKKDKTHLDLKSNLNECPPEFH